MIRACAASILYAERSLRRRHRFRRRRGRRVAATTAANDDRVPSYLPQAHPRDLTARCISNDSSCVVAGQRCGVPPRIGTGEDRRGAFADGGKEGGVKRATDGTPMSATRTSSCGGTSRVPGTAILDDVDIYPIFRLRWVCVLDGSLLSEEEDYSVAGHETATDI
ncbi:hypothetical protein G5I_12411 [Acromyrmex echinatior]|uniref:Uncharacterized protein n=1 Tax=Acromyrmex echinatior TaxID=103372 RepID=F4X289_ACREC|nr:hypothetical protein G5I_12411 [Acromyrmex echinatior]